MQNNKNIFLSLILSLFVSFGLADNLSINNNSRDCEGLSQDECTENPDCDWTFQATPNGEIVEFCSDANSWNDDGGWDDGGHEWESECNGLSFEDCEYLDFCEWMTVGPVSDFGICVEAENMDDGGEEEGDDCYSVNNPFECFAIGCEWNQEEGCYDPEDSEEVDGCPVITPEYPEGTGEYYCFGCEMFISECEYLECTENGWIGPFTIDDCGDEWGSECNGLGYEDCEYLDFCMWMANSDDPTANGFCVAVGDWNDDGGWNDCNPDLACATVLTCIDGLLYPTACGPENCDDPIGDCDDGGDSCDGLSLDECVLTAGCQPNFSHWGEYEGCFETDNAQGCWEDGVFYCLGCEVFIQECVYLECTLNGWSGPYETDDCNDDGGDFEDQCNQFGYDECLDAPDCEWVSDNDYAAFGTCVETDNDEGPPECVLDCPGIDDIDPQENADEACDWVISTFGISPNIEPCYDDCDQETLAFINEILEGCYECLSENTNIVSDCSDVFNDDECSDLDYEECSDAADCEWVSDNDYTAFGSCVDSDNNYGDGVLFGSVSYIYGDYIDFVPGALVQIESIGTITGFSFIFETYTNGDGIYEIAIPSGAYLVTAHAMGESQIHDVFVQPGGVHELNFILGEFGGGTGGEPEEEAVLSLGNAIISGTSNVVLPLNIYSTESVGGVQFTITTPSPISENMLIPAGIESTYDCFSADYNNLEGQFIGIIFSLEGCTYEADVSEHIADLVFELPEWIDMGTEIPLIFVETIVSDSEGTEIPSHGENGYVLIGQSGDINGDGDINVLDVVLVVSFAIYTDNPTEYEFWASDINDDGAINVLDVVQIVSLILSD